MLIIGCDFHTRYQQIAMAREETAEIYVERRLDHESGEAHAFYRSLQNLQEPVRVGIEATGPIHWFERLLTELGHELWIGDSAKIRASEVRKQKTDERDARLILDLLLAKRFPKIWVPTPAERDLRQLLWHRHKLVCMRTMLGNQLHALAMSQGLCRKQKLFTKKGRVELGSLTLGPWAGRRREELLKLLEQLEAPIAELDRAVLEEAQRREDALSLMTHPGIGPVTSLAFVLAIGPITRFSCSRKIASYLGLNPTEDSSGGSEASANRATPVAVGAAVAGNHRGGRSQPLSTRALHRGAKPEIFCARSATGKRVCACHGERFGSYFLGAAGTRGEPGQHGAHSEPHVADREDEIAGHAVEMQGAGMRTPGRQLERVLRPAPGRPLRSGWLALPRHGKVSSGARESRTPRHGGRKFRKEPKRTHHVLIDPDISMC
ncbi:MAG: IS110 family transposase [Candidatus Acidiferrum sp.]